MTEQPYPSPPRLSRQLVQVMMEMKSQLRQHGVTIALTEPDAMAQLMRAAEAIEDDTLTRLRQHCLTLVSSEAHPAPASPLDTSTVSAQQSAVPQSHPALSAASLPSPDGAAEPMEATDGQDQGGLERGVSTPEYGELKPHAASATPEAVQVFLRAMERDQLTCEQCHATLRVPEANPPATDPLVLTCSCGRRLQVEADLRRYRRKATQCPGRYVELKRGESGSVVVENISFGGLQFRTPEAHTLVRRDGLRVQFTLDDADHSVVEAPVTVRHVEGHRIGVRFAKTDTFDPRLAAYLMR